MWRMVTLKIYYDSGMKHISDKYFIEKIKRFKQTKMAVYIGVGTLWCSFASILFYSPFHSVERDQGVNLEQNLIEDFDFHMDVLIDTLSNFVVEENSYQDSISSIEQCFQYYCDIYQVKKDLIYQKADMLTNHFTSTEWIENYHIPGTRTGSKERIASSSELGILLFVRHVKQIPNDFGFTNEEIACDQTYELHSSYEEFTEKTCNLLDHLDSSLCQAIQYHETGHYNLEVDSFREHHNPAGIRDSNGDYWHFDNVAEGILELAIQLEYNYLIDRDIVSFDSIEEQIVKIQEIYCPLSDERDVYGLNQYWVQGVTDCYYEIVHEKQMASHVK